MDYGIFLVDDFVRLRPLFSSKFSFKTVILTNRNNGNDLRDTSFTSVSLFGDELPIGLPIGFNHIAISKYHYDIFGKHIKHDIFGKHIKHALPPVVSICEEQSLIPLFFRYYFKRFNPNSALIKDIPFDSSLLSMKDLGIEINEQYIRITTNDNCIISYTPITDTKEWFDISVVPSVKLLHSSEELMDYRLHKMDGTELHRLHYVGLDSIMKINNPSNSFPYNYSTTPVKNKKKNKYSSDMLPEKEPLSLDIKYPNYKLKLTPKSKLL